MKKKIIILIVLFLSVPFTYAGDLTLTTYYPAPHGAYDRLLLVPRATLATPCDVGTIYANNSNNELQYCSDGTWGPLSSVWEQTGDNLYPVDTASNPNLFVGIGTTNPAVPFHVSANSTGLISRFQGTYNILDINMPVSGGGEIRMFSNLAGTETVRISSSTYSGGQPTFFNAGKVGIGTSSPASQLEVAGTGEIRLTESSPQIYFNDSDSGAWKYWLHNNGNRLYFLTDGGTGGGWNSDRPLTILQNRVGVGTASPGGNVALDVYGGAVIRNANGQAHTWFPWTDGEIYITGDEDQSGTGDIHFRSFSTSGGYNEKAVIKGDSGNVGIGTGSPVAGLHVNKKSILFGGASFRGNYGSPITDTVMEVRGTDPLVGIVADNGAGLWFSVFPPSGTVGLYSNHVDGGLSALPMTFTVGGVERMRMHLDGTVTIGTPSDHIYTFYVNGAAGGTNFWQASDVRWKKNIKTIPNALNTVLQLRGVSHKWRIDEFPNMNFKKNNSLGLIAQEVEKIIPEVVATDNDGFKSVSYNELIPVLVEAVKELKEENNALKARIEALENGL